MRIDADYARRLHNFRNRKKTKKKVARTRNPDSQTVEQQAQEADSNANRGNARAGKRATTD